MGFVFALCGAKVLFPDPSVIPSEVVRSTDGMTVCLGDGETLDCVAKMLFLCCLA